MVHLRSAQWVSEGPRAYQDQGPERAQPAGPSHATANPTEAAPLVARATTGSGCGKTSGLG
eukprot:12790565-Heterocapsa_arctica.AAC.1